MEVSRYLSRTNFPSLYFWYLSCVVTYRNAAILVLQSNTAIKSTSQEKFLIKTHNLSHACRSNHEKHPHQFQFNVISGFQAYERLYDMHTHVYIGDAFYSSCLVTVNKIDFF